MFLFCSLEVKPVGPAAVSFSTAPIWGRLTGLIDRPLEMWTGFSRGGCDDPRPVFSFANSATLELKQNPRLVGVRRE
jgi:hypothetical protein